MKKPLLKGKWASRKLWSLVFALGLLILNEVLGLGISPDAYWAIAGLVSSYLIGQGVADMQKTK